MTTSSQIVRDPDEENFPIQTSKASVGSEVTKTSVSVAPMKPKGRGLSSRDSAFSTPSKPSVTQSKAKK